MLRTSNVQRSPFYGRFQSRTNVKAVCRFGKFDRVAEFYTWENFWGLRKLRPQTRSVERWFNKEFFLYEQRVWRPTSIMNMKLYTQIPLLLWFTFYWYQTVKMFMPDDIIENPRKIDGRYSADPNRIPWPLLHKQVTDMREGKLGIEELAQLWEHVKYYYGEDWLIPLEIVQILKYTTGIFLKQYVADPEAMRQEITDQLLRIHYDKVNAEWRVNADVKEVISLAVDDLEQLGRLDADYIPLVPANTGI